MRIKFLQTPSLQKTLVGELDDDTKRLLMNCFANTAWVNENGRIYYDALYNALHPSALPDGYQRVAWVQTVDGAYIDTGVTTMDGVTTAVDFRIPNPPTDTTPKVILGYGNRACHNVGQPYQTNAIGLYPSAFFTTPMADFENRGIMVIDWGEVSTSASYGGETITHIRADYKEHSSLVFGMSWTASQVSIMPTRFYSVTNSGLVSQRFVPCYRKSDGEIGMYELVSDTFFGNAGTGSLIKGDDV